ncbi:hypothetical protein [Psychrobacillus sp. NPDC096623]|uniref:hypothetical protein n=1 Tax=Psychrobacillus sp. NPDC096623 TaxID=3364492 RepID=UPI003819538F
MKTVVKVIQWFGVIVSMIALLLVNFGSPVNTKTIGILMTIAILSGIFGGLLGKISKLSLVALIMSFLAVMSYFYIDDRILFKIFLLISIVLILTNAIMDLQKNKKQYEIKNK